MIQLLFVIDLSYILYTGLVKSNPNPNIHRVNLGIELNTSTLELHIGLYVSSSALAKMPIEKQKKPRFLSLMPFKAIEEAYLNDFKSTFTLDIRLNLS
jgi:hypothetical protein